MILVMGVQEGSGRFRALRSFSQQDILFIISSERSWRASCSDRLIIRMRMTVPVRLGTTLITTQQGGTDAAAALRFNTCTLHYRKQIVNVEYRYLIFKNPVVTWAESCTTHKLVSTNFLTIDRWLKSNIAVERTNQDTSTALSLSG